MINLTKFSQLFTLIKSNERVSIINYKKKDGTSRDIHCTLKFDAIPNDKHPKPREKTTMKSMSGRGYIVVFDVEKSNWRTLVIGKILRCEVDNKIYGVGISGKII